MNPRTIGVFAMVALLGLSSAACSYDPTSVRRAELKAQETNYKLPTYITVESFAELQEQAHRLSEAYLELSSSAAMAQDATAVGLIASAAVAAGGLIFGAHSDLASGAALGAGVIAAGNSYASPGEASAHLLNASDQLLCVVQASNETIAGDISKLYLADRFKTFDDERIALTRITISQVRINLRKSLKRELPNYGQMVDSLVASAKKSDEAENNKPEADPSLLASYLSKNTLGEVQEDAIRKLLKAANAKLETDLDACVLKQS